uniref:Uncharacterized protein n=1 Tax=Cucumis melo TaxID=3656 RepID=A0A9I9E6X9_CUCME
MMTSHLFSAIPPSHDCRSTDEDTFISIHRRCLCLSVSLFVITFITRFP